MMRMAPISRMQTGTIGRYLNFLRQKNLSFDGFETRELAMYYRIAGYQIAELLPGLGVKERWLGRRTDEDHGSYEK